jgi:hypothetical protein
MATMTIIISSLARGTADRNIGPAARLDKRPALSLDSGQLEGPDMSFLMVQLLSLAGVLVVIALTWAVGWGRAAKIASLDQAAERFHADFPAAEIKAGAVAADGSAALLDLGDALGLVMVLGDELVTRKLRPRDIAVAPGDNGLTLTLADPTLPRVRLALQADDAAKWMARMNPVLA